METDGSPGLGRGVDTTLDWDLKRSKLFVLFARHTTNFEVLSSGNILASLLENYSRIPE